MATVTLVPVQDLDQIEAVAKMAELIWREHYLPILGEAQVSYMLEHLQSQEKISEDVFDKRSHYFMIQAAGRSVGYTAIEWHEADLFVSKLYLLQETRGKGYAYQTMLEFIKLAKEQNLAVLSLTVNKDNDVAIQFYEKLGFDRIDEVVSPIGNGFVMDDYIYQYKI